MKDALLSIIKRAGGQKALAARLGCSQQSISWWLQNGVPPKWVKRVITEDRKLGGKTTPAKLRPDIFEIRG